MTIIKKMKSQPVFIIIKISAYITLFLQLTVLGTPAEEGLGGKVQLIDAGALDTVDVAMMAHPSNKTIWRPKYLCVQG